GSDVVGPFTFSGSYDAATGTCRWTKQYLGKHWVSYTGVNEGQGIWGVWEINLLWGLIRDRGVFHIWPQGMTPSEGAELTVRAFLEPAASGSVWRPVLGLGVVLVVVCLLLSSFLSP